MAQKTTSQNLLSLGLAAATTLLTGVEKKSSAPNLQFQEPHAVVRITQQKSAWGVPLSDLSFTTYAKDGQPVEKPSGDALPAFFKQNPVDSTEQFNLIQKSETLAELPLCDFLDVIAKSVDPETQDYIDQTHRYAWNFYPEGFLVQPAEYTFNDLGNGKVTFDYRKREEANPVTYNVPHHAPTKVKQNAVALYTEQKATVTKTDGEYETSFVPHSLEIRAHNKIYGSSTQRSQGKYALRLNTNQGDIDKMNEGTPYEAYFGTMWDFRESMNLSLPGGPRNGFHYDHDRSMHPVMAPKP